MEEEEWREIEETGGWYQVSNLGRVSSVERTVVDRGTGRRRVFSPRVLKGSPTSYMGHLHVGLYTAQGVKRALIHRLVAEAFIPNPKGYETVDHIDGDTANNKATNLRWASYHHNNANTPYVRYLIEKLESAGIPYLDQEDFYES